MYVWLLVTLAVAVGVLALAGILTSGDRDDSDDDAPASAWTTLWQDFLSGTSAVRAQLAQLRHRVAGTPGPSVPHTASGRTAGHPRPGHPQAGRADAPAPAADPAPPATLSATSWHERQTAGANTSFEEFFEATATDGPAYLDAAQLSDALHSLRR